MNLVGHIHGIGRSFHEHAKIKFNKTQLRLGLHREGKLVTPPLNLMNQDLYCYAKASKAALEKPMIMDAENVWFALNLI